jgi:signal transduction histidine kinase
MAEPSSVPPGPPADAPGDILVVDDSPGNLVAIEAALGDFGSRVVSASSGAEALRFLLRQDFALILLDVQMPTMDGFQTARLIRERSRSRHTPIIFITAYQRNDDDILKAYELGAVDFMFKPIVASVLRAKARVFVDLQRRTAEVARQAELIREHGRREHEREMAEERRRWEEEALRRRVEEERRAAAEMARKAEELARMVAELERAERELTRMNTQLAEADRRKDEFLAVLAHELRNPLAAIVTSLELLRLQVAQDGDPVLRRARDAMDRQVRHLRRLIDDLLDVSRINSGKITLDRRVVEMSDVVREALNISEPLIQERSHRLNVALSEEPLILDADSVRLTQVLANLLNNAARYTSNGGNISLACERDGDDVLLRVADDGQGIPPDVIDRIFDMFVQQRSGGGGLGIGLTLVKRLVEMHGGTVTARSQGSGKGSEFAVRLPLVQTAGDRISLERPSQTQLQPNVLRIVLVEDNPDIRNTLNDLLCAWGHVVFEADNGRRGVELIVRERPDVAIVDIGLPELDGYGVAEQVRRVLPEHSIRLVAMTGYGQDKDRQRALASGFDAHLVKPATGDELRRALIGMDGPMDGTPSSRPPPPEPARELKGSQVTETR